MAEFNIRNWLPQEPWQGPPLPEFLNIYWPWYKPEGNGGNGLPDILEPVYLASCVVDPFSIIADSGWWGVIYHSIMNVTLTYQTESQVPPEPSNLARIIFTMTMAGKQSLIISTPINQVTGPFWFPAGTTIISRGMGFSWGDDLALVPYGAGDMASYEILIEALLAEPVGRRTFTGEVECIGLA